MSRSKETNSITPEAINCQEIVDEEEQKTFKGSKSLMLNSENTGRVFMNPFLYNLRIKITFSSLLKSLVGNIMKNEPHRRDSRRSGTFE